MMGIMFSTTHVRMKTNKPKKTKKPKDLEDSGDSEDQNDTKLKQPKQNDQLSEDETSAEVTGRHFGNGYT